MARIRTIGPNSGHSGNYAKHNFWKYRPSIDGWGEIVDQSEEYTSVLASLRDVHFLLYEHTLTPNLESTS